MVSDLLAVLAEVGPLAEHALVPNDPHSKVVYCHPMVLPAHNLRGYKMIRIEKKGRDVTHVARSSRGVFGIVRVPHPCNSQICDPHISYHKVKK